MAGWANASLLSLPIWLLTLFLLPMFAGFVCVCATGDKQQADGNNTRHRRSQFGERAI